jgi:hypothetical protein
MSGNSYYIPTGDSTSSRIPAGEYKAMICDIEVMKDMRCGGFIADVFKPIYRIIQSDYEGTEIKDSGLFRYKEAQGYQFKPNRNWGFAKFCQILGIQKDTGGKVSLPYLQLSMLNNIEVMVAISYKNFVNKEGTNVSYPVAVLKKKIEEVPF